MEFEHELIIPNDGVQFKIFQFEGKDGNYFRDMHWHRSIEIMAVYKGRLTVCVNDKKNELNPGEFFLVNSNEIHAIDSPDMNQAIVVQIPIRTFEPYYTGDEFVYFDNNLGKHDFEIMEMIRKIYREVTEKGIGYEYKAQSVFFELIYTLVSQYRTQEVNPDILKRYKKISRLSAITGYIKDHYCDDLSLEGISERFGYSMSYLSRMFQKYAQVNYKTYLQNVRVEYAFQELMNTDHTISEIALNNGFPNTKAFSREFQKRYGILPSEFRRNRKKGKA